jgi:hypothetical protein
MKLGFLKPSAIHGGPIAAGGIKKLPKGKPWLPPHLALKWWELAAAGNPPRPKTLLNQ